MNSHRQLNFNNTQSAKNMEKLSSGFRINRAGDDAAGLAISEKMRGQIRGLNMASKNAQDSISLIQTAEGALNETHSILQRMRELAVQSANDTNTTSDRKEIQKEIDQLTAEIDRIGNTTEFNTQKLLNGEKAGLRDAVEAEFTLQNNSRAEVSLDLDSLSSGQKGFSGTGTVIITKTGVDTSGKATYDVQDPLGTLPGVDLSSGKISATGLSGITITNIDKLDTGESVTVSIKGADAGNKNVSGSLSMQIGANTGQNILIGIEDMRAEAIGVRNASGNTLDVTDAKKASAAITTINNAIETVSAQRSKLGAFQNRLEHTINNLGTASENLQAAESRIRDVDMAKEMMTFTKNNILTQAAQAMLAQANQQPQGVLQLLR